MKDKTYKIHTESFTDIHVHVFSSSTKRVFSLIISKSTASGSVLSLLWSRKNFAHCLGNMRKSSIVPGGLTSVVVVGKKLKTVTE
jgi:hypothetical protein